MAASHHLHAMTGWLLRSVLRYRTETVRANLDRAFPALPEPERRSLMRRVYTHLARVIFETLADPSKAGLDRRIVYTPSPEMDHWVAQGQSVVAVMGHVGNWEWTGAYIGNIYPDHFCALYRRIKNPWLNRMQFARRSKHARYLLESRQTTDLLRLLKSTPVVLLLIADQNPGSDQGLDWVPFFNGPTAFTTGPESIAMRYKTPVVYLHSLPLPDGRYTFRWETIWDGRSPVGRGEITRRFADRLEANIREAPHAWLWTHRRWKRTPPPEAGQA